MLESLDDDDASPTSHWRYLTVMAILATAFRSSTSPKSGQVLLCGMRAAGSSGRAQGVWRLPGPLLALDSKPPDNAGGRDDAASFLGLQRE